MPIDEGSLARLHDDIEELSASRDKHGERLGELKEKLGILEDRLKQRQDHWHSTANEVHAMLLAESKREGRIEGMESFFKHIASEVQRVDGDRKAATAAASTEHRELHERLGRVQSAMELRVESRERELLAKIDALEKDAVKKFDEVKSITWGLALKLAALTGVLGSGVGAGVAKLIGGN